MCLPHARPLGQGPEMLVVISCSHWSVILGPKERTAVRSAAINYSFLLQLYLPVVSACSFSSLSRLPEALSLHIFSLLAHPSPPAVQSALDGRRQANSWGRGLLAGESKRALATDIQLIGLRVSKPLWGNALHSWDRISLQPWGKHKISGRTSRIAQ